MPGPALGSSMVRFISARSYPDHLGVPDSSSSARIAARSVFGSYGGSGVGVWIGWALSYLSMKIRLTVRSWTPGTFSNSGHRRELGHPITIGTPRVDGVDPALRLADRRTRGVRLFALTAGQVALYERYKDAWITSLNFVRLRGAQLGADAV
jgi:hypothetical protein